MLLGLWANAGNVNKGVLKQMIVPFSAYYRVKTLKVKEGFAMAWIDMFY